VDPLGGPSMAMRKELELGARSRLLALEKGGKRGVLKSRERLGRIDKLYSLTRACMKPHKVVRTHSGSFWCWDSHG